MLTIAKLLALQWCHPQIAVRAAIGAHLQQGKEQRKSVILTCATLLVYSYTVVFSLGHIIRQATCAGQH
jgi:hypothetical protein